jgi:hypothetical protein
MPHPVYRAQTLFLLALVCCYASLPRSRNQHTIIDSLASVNLFDDDTFDIEAAAVCNSLRKWRDALAEYADFHSSALAQLRLAAAELHVGSAPEMHLPGLTVYHFVTSESQIGIGDAVSF